MCGAGAGCDGVRDGCVLEGRGAGRERARFFELLRVRDGSGQKILTRVGLYGRLAANAALARSVAAQAELVARRSLVTLN